MRITTLKHTHATTAHIHAPRARVVTFELTVDLQTTRTLEQEACGLVYKDILLRGAGTYTRSALLDTLHKLGADISISWENNFCTLSVRCLSENTKKVLSLVSTIISAPIFDTKEISKVRKQNINDLHEYKENAKARALESLRNTLFGDADRRCTGDIDALIATIPNISKKMLQSFHMQMRSGHWILTVGGKKPDAQLVVQTLLKQQLTSKHTQEKVHITRARTTPSVNLLHIPSAQNIEFSIGNVAPLYVTDTDFPAFVFGLAVLGKWGGFAGRLMSTVREKEGLTYGIYARTETIQAFEFGYWRIMTFFLPQKAKAALQSTFREINTILLRGITDKELRRFKIILKTQNALIFDSLERTTAHVHGLHCSDVTIEEYEKNQKRMQTLTKKEVHNALKKYLDLSSVVISAAGPITPQIAKEIRSVVPTTHK